MNKQIAELKEEKNKLLEKLEKKDEELSKFKH
jgi:hypothetical protein